MWSGHESIPQPRVGETSEPATRPKIIIRNKTTKLMIEVFYRPRRRLIEQNFFWVFKALTEASSRETDVTLFCQSRCLEAPAPTTKVSYLKQFGRLFKQHSFLREQPATKQNISNIQKINRSVQVISTTGKWLMRGSQPKLASIAHVVGTLLNSSPTRQCVAPWHHSALPYGHETSEQPRYCEPV